MSDAPHDTQIILLAKAKEMFGIVIKCTHNHVTLVQHQHKELGWFACYQCDDCGTITRLEVTPDDLDAAVNAPFLDVGMYMQATKEDAPEQAMMRALEFLGKAAR